ncbi:uncharacterized protein PV06_01652 [Exophiala oligosperma]|uniref:Serine-rich protein n=2 Tax=Chaetothyriales TaxID=34395 RepID=A0A0D2C854_9EURO|nr:uncharacterized protein PV06_01652 [Exophiala oligosperma]KAJ9617727.1 hypothetical protein H2204_013480 [Knufia peltigerae]KIW45952.1 hypothetical protein PV06_01652 [Exophiala oligosperma]
MSSSPSSVKQRSPKRTSPGRTPLAERTQSQANELSFRSGRDARAEQENISIYNTTPFPTKPAHVLLPSSIKKKKDTPGSSTSFFGFPWEVNSGRSNDGQRTPQGAARQGVKLKRSVKALRELYESQAEDSSCPSTATSPPLRPSTANSTRLRSVSSSESLSGAFAWDSLRKISSDDLALLPTLPAGRRPVKRLSSGSSFISIAERVAATSSPNYRVLGVTSSPRPPAFQDLSGAVLEPFSEDPSSSIAQDSSSSPNIVRLATTSSTEHLPLPDISSSPLVVKLGTSSPGGPRHGGLEYSRFSRSSSTSSRKRKRSETVGSTQSFAERAGARNPLASSPPLDPYIPTSAAASIISPDNRGFLSSAPQSIRQVEDSQDESSPIVRRIASSDLPSSDNSSLSGTHASLQAALSSSPPRIQYPIVRAPPRSQHVGLVVPKRASRSMSTDGGRPIFASRLSAVPSEASRGIKTRSASVASSELELDVDDYLHSDELAPASAYIINDVGNQSQIRIVLDQENESHEASDEVSALPSSDEVYRSPSHPSRSGSFIYSPTSSQQSRLNSMKSFTQLRHQHSFLSRPTSSGSTSTAANGLPIPTWAKRYYSGFYHDSFQYLYASNSQANLHNLALSPSRVSRPDDPNAQVSDNGSPQRPRSFHQVLTERVEALLKTRSRPRVEARKSHIIPGVGPLVSNPVREQPATAALHQRSQTYSLSRQQTPTAQNHNRSLSAPLSPADPRAHWAGVVEIHQQPLLHGRSSYTIHHTHYRRYSNGGYSVSPSESQSVIYHPSPVHQRTSRRWSGSPHLHHDNRLNTGSSASRGFGFPFNSHSRWTAPSIITTRSGGFMPRANLRSTQVACFALGFVVPLTWFVAAFLPLPRRPSSYADLEKAAYANAISHAARGSERTSRQQYMPPEEALSEWEQMDVLARLRTERQLAGAAELKFQNARWWRNLNRWMCAVGVVVCVLIIVLAVLGTRRKW